MLIKLFFYSENSNIKFQRKEKIGN